jgi:MoxR-like ATPase
MDIKEITHQVEKESLSIKQIVAEIEKVIVGQHGLIHRMLIGLLCEGHLLLEGLPGLAKTTAVKAMAQTIDTSFKRIQFTPDLLPADIIGTQIYRPDNGSFEVNKGPIFNNIILADEINRAPAKVQSALLEAMQERQVTIRDTTFKLDDPFLVMATQNPIEQEGTYPLPEAQIDRFMMKIKVDYPSAEEEKEIVKRIRAGADNNAASVVSVAALKSVRKTLHEIHMEDRLLDYIVRLTQATRNPDEFGMEIGSMVSYGASPRASIWLEAAARAQAFLGGRGYVTPQDIKSMAPEVFRHRIILSYEAEAEGRTTDHIINELLERIEVP